MSSRVFKFSKYSRNFNFYYSRAVTSHSNNSYSSVFLILLFNLHSIVHWGTKQTAPMCRICSQAQHDLDDIGLKNHTIQLHTYLPWTIDISRKKRLILIRLVVESTVLAKLHITTTRVSVVIKPKGGPSRYSTSDRSDSGSSRIITKVRRVIMLNHSWVIMLVVKSTVLAGGTIVDIKYFGCHFIFWKV